MAATVLIPLAWPALVTGQAKPSTGATRNVRGLSGAVSFAVPAAWDPIMARDTGSLAQFAYHIPNPAVDSTRDDAVNVVVNARRRAGVRTFKAFTDTVLAQLPEPSIVVLDDTILGALQRAVSWLDRGGATRYLGYDDFAESGELWVHVRISMPLGGLGTNWSKRFEDDTRRLFKSFRLDGRIAFPVRDRPSSLSEPAVPEQDGSRLLIPESISTI